MGLHGPPGEHQMGPHGPPKGFKEAPWGRKLGPADTKAQKESTHTGLGGSGSDFETDLGLQKGPQVLQNRVPKRIEIWN